MGASHPKNKFFMRICRRCGVKYQTKCRYGKLCEKCNRAGRGWK